MSSSFAIRCQTTTWPSSGFCWDGSWSNFWTWRTWKYPRIPMGWSTHFHRQIGHQSGPQVLTHPHLPKKILMAWLLMDIDGKFGTSWQGTRPFYTAIAMISIAASHNRLQHEWWMHAASQALPHRPLCLLSHPFSHEEMGRNQALSAHI